MGDPHAPSESEPVGSGVRLRARRTVRVPGHSLVFTFATISFAVVTLIGVTLGLVLQDAIRTRAITDAARTGEVAANVGVTPVLVPEDVERSFLPLPAERVEQLDATLGRSLSPNGIVRLKIWNREHWIVYSDNDNLIGRWFAGTDILERAFDGEITSELTDLTAPEEREERDFGQLLAVYAPLRLDDDGQFTADPSAPVVGAFEIYLPWKPIAADIAADTRRLYTALAIGLAVLYLALFRIVKRASNRIKSQAEENLRLATHDSLTGALNRDALVSLVDRSGTPAGGTSDVLVIVDVDRFQSVNESLGHPTGDRVLREIAARLQRAVRDQDAVARIGGDEFVVFMTAIEPGKTEAAVNRMLRLVETPIDLDGLPLQISLTAGAAVREPDLPATRLVQRADIALNAAKNNRIPTEIFTPALEVATTSALELAAEVKLAIATDQLELHYQPKFELHSRKILGVEALIRWRHPLRGLVPPYEFIPVVEELRVGKDLTEWVINQALDDLVRLRNLGLDLTLSVNVSAQDVADHRLADSVTIALAARKLPGRSLTIELTESSALANEQRAADVLGRIRRMGCGIAIDDFGTGYASINYLVRFPVSEVKIDQSFIREMIDDDQARQVVRHCVDIAHALGTTATGEGIETVEMEDMLKTFGLDVGQGYLVSKPLPFDDLVAMLKTTSSPIATGGRS